MSLLMGRVPPSLIAGKKSRILVESPAAEAFTSVGMLLGGARGSVVAEENNGGVGDAGGEAGIFLIRRSSVSDIVAGRHSHLMSNLPEILRIEK